MARILFLVLIGLAVAIGVNYYLMSSSGDAELQERMAGALPAAPAGWQFSDDNPLLQSFGDVSAARITRTYTGDSGTVRVTITRSAQAVVAAEAAGRNVLDPQMAALRDQSGPRYRALDSDGWRGWTGVDVEGRAEATAWQDDMLVQLVVEPSSERLLRDFMDGLDWDALSAP